MFFYVFLLCNFLVHNSIVLQSLVIRSLLRISFEAFSPNAPEQLL